MVKIKCDFCDKEINCPEEEINFEKHACYGCFKKQEEKFSDEELDKIQVDYSNEEINNLLVQEIVEDLFPLIWEDRKEELKDLSKKELAQFMFAAGASSMVQKFTEMEEDEEFNLEEE